MKLTKHNYHSNENTLISNSKVKLYAKSPALYKKRYIDLETPPLSKSLKIGRMVDCAFEHGNIKAIDNNFTAKFQRTCLKKHNPEQYDLETALLEKDDVSDENAVTQAEKDVAIAMSKKILNSDLYKWYKKPGMRRYFQKVVHDDRICGMLDVLVVDEQNKKCYIDDIKTSAVGDMDGGWLWKCKKYGYLSQLAIYKELTKRIYPDYEIICRHIVIGSAEPYPVELYVFDDSILEGHFDWFMKQVELIEKETEWKDKVPSWKDAEIIRNDVI